MPWAEEVRSRLRSLRGQLRRGRPTVIFRARPGTPHPHGARVVGAADRHRAADAGAGGSRGVMCTGRGRRFEVGALTREDVEASPHYEPVEREGDAAALGDCSQGSTWCARPDGRFRVIEDQVRMPAGLAYAVAARDTLRDLLGVEPPQAGPLPRVRRARAGPPGRRAGRSGRAARGDPVGGTLGRGVVGARAAGARAVHPSRDARGPGAA